ncbi:MAG: BadF/BadG/BcrA/BcrD ATPase family protein [Alphaproteobacteria bacterium]
MEDQLFLGIDGGGTKCRARLQDEAGHVLGEGEAGPANARLADGFEETLKATGQALAAAGLDDTVLAHTHAGFGLAGTGQDYDRLRVLDTPHPFASLAVDTDAYAAWLGAFGGEDGAILILGTGSCGLCVNKGQRMNVGGWGFEIADEGSGAALGRLTVRHAVWALEGMAPMTPFISDILTDFEGEAQNATLWAAAAEPGDFAAYAQRAFDFAENGDEVAIRIVEQNAAGALMMINRLQELGADKIAMIGGLFPRILPWLPDQARAVLCWPAADAADGAILMARRALEGIGTGR